MRVVDQIVQSFEQNHQNHIDSYHFSGVMHSDEQNFAGLVVAVSVQNPDHPDFVSLVCLSDDFDLQIFFIIFFQIINNFLDLLPRKKSVDFSRTYYFVQPLFFLKRVLQEFLNLCCQF